MWERANRVRYEGGPPRRGEAFSVRGHVKELKGSQRSTPSMSKDSPTQSELCVHIVSFRTPPSHHVRDLALSQRLANASLDGIPCLHHMLNLVTSPVV